MQGRMLPPILSTPLAKDCRAWGGVPAKNPKFQTVQNISDQVQDFPQSNSIDSETYGTQTNSEISPTDKEQGT